MPERRREPICSSTGPAQSCLCQEGAPLPCPQRGPTGHSSRSQSTMPEGLLAVPLGHTAGRRAQAAWLPLLGR